MRRRPGARRTGAVIDTQQVFGRREHRDRPDFRDLGAAGRRATFGSEGEHPDLARDFRDQRGGGFMFHRRRVPAVRADRSLGIGKRGEILDTPVERPLGKLLDLLLDHRLHDILLRDRPEGTAQDE